RHAAVAVGVRRERVDVEVRANAARREAGELDEAAVEVDHVVVRRGAVHRARHEAAFEIGPQGAVFGLRAQVDRDGGAGAHRELARVGAAEATGGRRGRGAQT